MTLTCHHLALSLHLHPPHHCAPHPLHAPCCCPPQLQAPCHLPPHGCRHHIALHGCMHHVTVLPVLVYPLLVHFLFSATFLFCSPVIVLSQSLTIILANGCITILPLRA